MVLCVFCLFMYMNVLEFYHINIYFISFSGNFNEQRLVFDVIVLLNFENIYFGNMNFEFIFISLFDIWIGYICMN